jgi:hypothetical protein
MTSRLGVILDHYYATADEAWLIDSLVWMANEHEFDVRVLCGDEAADFEEWMENRQSFVARRRPAAEPPKTPSPQEEERRLGQRISWDRPRARAQLPNQRAHPRRRSGRFTLPSHLAAARRCKPTSDNLHYVRSGLRPKSWLLTPNLAAGSPPPGVK